MSRNVSVELENKIKIEQFDVLKKELINSNPVAVFAYIKENNYVYIARVKDHISEYELYFYVPESKYSNYYLDEMKVIDLENWLKYIVEVHWGFELFT
jgi:hypothetical protein